MFFVDRHSFIRWSALTVLGQTIPSNVHFAILHPLACLSFLFSFSFSLSLYLFLFLSISFCFRKSSTSEFKFDPGHHEGGHVANFILRLLRCVGRMGLATVQVGGCMEANSALRRQLSSGLGGIPDRDLGLLTLCKSFSELKLFKVLFCGLLLLGALFTCCLVGVSVFFNSRLHRARCAPARRHRSRTHEKLASSPCLRTANHNENSSYSRQYRKSDKFRRKFRKFRNVFRTFQKNSEQFRTIQKNQKNQNNSERFRTIQKTTEKFRMCFSVFF